VGGALEKEVDLGLAIELGHGVAVRGHEEPEVPCVVDFADVHGTNSFGLATGSAGAKEAGFGFIDDVLDALDSFCAAEVLAIFLRLIFVNGIHRSLIRFTVPVGERPFCPLRT
jgi:hypothetical protein